MKEKIFKYIKTVALWILIVSFFTSFVNFSTNLNSYLRPVKISTTPLDNNLISEAKKIESNLNELTDGLKDSFGDDYPALGIVYYKAILHYSSNTVVQNFLFSIIAGFGLGNIVFFIFVDKYKKYKLFFALLIALLCTSILFGLSDLLTNFANNEKLEFSISTVLWNMEVTVIPYCIVAIVLIVINKIYSTYKEIRFS